VQVHIVVGITRRLNPELSTAPFPLLLTEMPEMAAVEPNVVAENAKIFVEIDDGVVLPEAREDFDDALHPAYKSATQARQLHQQLSKNQKVFCRFDHCGTTFLHTTDVEGEFQYFGEGSSQKLLVCPLPKTTFASSHNPLSRIRSTGGIRAGMAGDVECQVRVSFNGKHFSSTPLDYLLVAEPQVFNYDVGANPGGRVSSSGMLSQGASPLKLKGAYFGRHSPMECLFKVQTGKTLAGDIVSSSDREVQCVPPVVAPKGYYGSVDLEMRPGDDLNLPPTNLGMRDWTTSSFRHFTDVVPTGFLTMNLQHRISPSLGANLFIENTARALSAELEAQEHGKAVLDDVYDYILNNRVTGGSLAFGNIQHNIFDLVVEALDTPFISHIFPHQKFFVNTVMPFVYIFGGNFPESAIAHCRFFTKGKGHSVGHLLDETDHDDGAASAAVLNRFLPEFEDAAGVRISPSKVACDFPHVIRAGYHSISVLFATGQIATTVDDTFKIQFIC
jgi:hypothetical protein